MWHPLKKAERDRDWEPVWQRGSWDRVKGPASELPQPCPRGSARLPVSWPSWSPLKRERPVGIGWFY